MAGMMLPVGAFEEKVMQTEAGSPSHDNAARPSDIKGQLQGVLVVVASAAVMIGLAYGAMALLSSPAGWVMKVANQAMTDHQQAVAISFAMNSVD
jgi:hypothetical protein